MTSVLPYRPHNDPFASSDLARAYPSPPFSPQHSHSTTHRQPPHTPPTIMPSVRPATAGHNSPTPASRTRVSPGGSAYLDEFGAYPSTSSSAAGGAVGGPSSASTSAVRSATAPMAGPVPIPATPEHQTASPGHRQRWNNRQSHNPAATFASASPPKPEHLTDEYVLHPSVWNYKQAHPRRPMVGFGPYVLLQTLGEGEFGKVKLGVHTEFGVEVAIKLIRRGSLDDEVRASKVEREIDVLKTLKHPNIVRMFDVIDTEKYIGIVLEFAGGGELFDHILASRYLKEKDAQKLFAQLISGVDYLHKKHIVHRDLKLENLLLDKHRNIIITDFGFANRFDSEQDDLMATSCGSPCYAAPELVVSEGLYVGSAVDIWSCGVILYAMLSGYLPYDDDPSNPDGDNINLLYKYIMSTKLNFPEHMSAAAKHLLQIMLVPNPEHRCSILDIMNHPWLANYRDTFNRSVEDHEYVFQESMYRKSQTAKRELAERRKVQIEGKQAKQAFARSQSSVPGTTVTAGMLDHHRRAREARHHSALPGTTTMPEYLNKAGAMPPPASVPLQAGTRQSLPLPAIVPAVPQTTSVTANAAVVSPMPVEQATHLPSPPASSTTKSSPPRPRSESLGAGSSPRKTDESSAAIASNETVENEPMDVDAAPKSAEPTKSSRPPMSANKNRHTIQVEYDGEASYEKMKEVLRAKKAAAASNGASIPVMPAPPTPVRLSERSSPDKSTLASDVEMESGSEIGHTEEGTLESTQEGTSEDATPAASQVLTPPAVTPPSNTIMEVTSEEVGTVAMTLPVPSLPSTPSKKGKEPARVQDGEGEPTSPTTSRASQHEETIEEMVTPRPHSKKHSVHSPRSGGKRSESMPANAIKPVVSSKPDETTPVATPAPGAANPALNASGLPRVPSPKSHRYRKGMSLDKFGLAKLLGQAHASSTSDVSRPPMSASAATAARLQSQQSRQSADTPEPQQQSEEGGLFRSRSQRSKRQSMVRPRAAGEADNKSEKKTRRRTLQLMVNRGTSSRGPKSAPLAPRDMNPPANPVATPAQTPSATKLEVSPPLVIDSEGIQPSTNPERGQSSPSIVTVDAFAAQQTSPQGNKTASSSAAKKVMEWFRKKSLARDTLVSLKQAGVKSDSASSFVQVSDSPIRGAAKNDQAKIGSSANLAAMSSTSSVAGTAEGPSPPTVPDVVPESATLPRQPPTPTKTSPELPAPLIVPIAAPASSGAASSTPSGATTPTRVPLGSAANKTNIESSTTSLIPASHGSMPLPSRSKSHMPSTDSTDSSRPAIPAKTPTKVPLRGEKNSPSRMSERSSDEMKMRVHTGLVDQSALSSKPPKDVMVEVLRVLQGMGMDIKKENDFKLRCTRVRRRKAGATTGLGLGSVMSVGSGMGPFSLMNSASTSKTDGRGLPISHSPSSGGILSSASGGLKGMLLRRGSSYSAHNVNASLSRLAGTDSDLLASPSASTIGFGSPVPGTPGSPSAGVITTQKEPLYGEHSVDSGDEVKFIVELCRIKNLPGLYLLTIKRLRGSVWSFKFIYQTVIERCETLTH